MKLWTKKTVLLLILSSVFFVASVILEVTNFSTILYRICLILFFVCMGWFCYRFSLYQLYKPKKEKKDDSNK